MELLLSNLPPAKFSNRTMQTVWNENISISEYVRIATGYISSDSLIELKKIVELNSNPNIDLLIGMHYFEGFTKQQYEAAISLNNTLTSKGRGAVYISNSLKFHGKLYSFNIHDKCIGAIVGSSNMSNIVNSPYRVYESDCFFKDSEAKLIDNSIIKLFEKLGTKISDVHDVKILTNNDLLDNHYGVEKVLPQELVKIWDTKTETCFEIPMKTEPKSNLNVYFGKGRENNRGFVIPRPWYEVEIIVPISIRKLSQFPVKKSFTVVTQDGWKFKCRTNGDYGKNLRSADDLLILGKWIKGKMEQLGALSMGEPVTKNVLYKYGKDTLKLYSTSDPDLWLMEF